MKKIMFCVGLLLVSKAAFAARATVYNDMGKNIAVIAWSENGTLQAKGIPMGHQYTFNNNTAVPFMGMYVTDNLTTGGFLFPTPSSKTMLQGSIKIGPNLDQCAINFTKDGASSNTVKNVKHSEVVSSAVFQELWKQAKAGSGESKLQ